MILNTGQRTDIPAFYSEWFTNRLREGFVCVRNPYDPKQVSRYRLDPSVVDVIGFCSKNPAPMFPYMELLREYGQYWYVTITPYGKEIEPGVPDKEKVMEDFCRLSEMVGFDSIGWRYDPIFLNDTYTLEYHCEAFAKMAERLKGYTGTVVISFIDLYQKVQRNFPEARTVSLADRLLLGESMAKAAKRCGMVLRPCAEGDLLAPFGADCSGCMTVPMYEKAIGARLKVPKKKAARAECACYLSGDIGAYDTCRHFCRYCYANSNAEAVRRNSRLHDPSAPFLVGNYEEGDVISDAVQNSWIEKQLSLSDWMGDLQPQ